MHPSSLICLSLPFCPLLLKPPYQAVIVMVYSILPRFCSWSLGDGCHRLELLPTFWAPTVQSALILKYHLRQRKLSSRSQKIGFWFYFQLYLVSVVRNSTSNFGGIWWFWTFKALRVTCKAIMFLMAFACGFLAACFIGTVWVALCAAYGYIFLMPSKKHQSLGPVVAPDWSWMKGGLPGHLYMCCRAGPSHFLASCEATLHLHAVSVAGWRPHLIWNPGYCSQGT